MKRIFLFFMLFSNIWFLAFAQDIIDFKYKIDNNEITIIEYNGSIKDVKIPGKINDIPIVSIGIHAFFDMQLTSVNIPNSVTSIGYGAFFANQLKSINIPNSVTSIEEAAFGRNRLTDITIPNSITIIETNTFSENQLNSVNIPNSVTSIGYGAFSYNQLNSINIPDSVTSIGQTAFRDNQLTSITIPNSVTSIKDWTFFKNKLTSVNIPDSITSIGRYAFSRNLLTNVTIPASVTSIGDYAFSDNRLTRVVILNPLTSIGENAFIGEIGRLLFKPDDSNNFADKIQADIYLDNLANELNKLDLIKGNIHIYGYAAFAQNNIDPIRLSRDRALFVIKELEKRGVPSVLFAEPSAFGSVDLWGSNSNEDNRKQNRRVLILIEPVIIIGTNDDTIQIIAPN